MALSPAIILLAQNYFAAQKCENDLELDLSEKKEIILGLEGRSRQEALKILMELFPEKPLQTVVIVNPKPLQTALPVALRRNRA